MDVSPKAAGFSKERLDRIAEHLNRSYIDNGKVAGCQVLVARHGHPAYFASLGEMDRERKKKVKDDTIFRLYSMTKPITSVALMTLYEKGYFQLNDPVHRFVPEWRDHRVWVSGEGPTMETARPARPVSMRDMLCHTGGLTYGSQLVALGAPDSRHPVDKVYTEIGVRRGEGETLSEFVKKLGRVPLRYQPGERWMYSLSTDVCGALVEIISGKRFDVFLQEEIFAPLKMEDTSFSVESSKLPRFAANYRRGPDKKLELIDDPEKSTYLKTPTFFSGGGGLTGTTRDYWRFCEMLRRGGELDGARILGPRTIELMHLNHLKDGKDLTDLAIAAFSETANEGVGFGLGFATVLDRVKSGSIAAGEYYWGGAASTIF
ncbi:MAG: beta-lactamase family protein, partial [Alphaproteobacteria bacterium]|nr:beta-lactamase family protein [Alphaproteobacteria bacterium]